MKIINVSIIIPVYNEKDNLEILVEEIRSVMAGCEGSYEVIFVDDGSTDGTGEILRELCRRFSEVKAIFFRRNFGQSAAMAAGFDFCKGEVVISMDGDLQNDPKDIPKLIAKIREGYDVVNGWRKSRKDPFLSRRFPSLIANKLIGWITGVKVHDYGCSMRAYKAEVVKNLGLYGELHRFIPVLASLYGVKHAEIEVNHRPRIHGRSKYSISRIYRVLSDLLLVLFFQKFMTRPLHVFGPIGGIMVTSGIIIEVYLSFIKLVFGYDIGQRPLLLLGVLLILSGTGILGTGLVAELVMRTYYESQGKKPYLIREVLGNSDEEMDKGSSKTPG